MKKFTIKDIKVILKDIRIVGESSNIYFSNVKPITEANNESLVWVNPTRKDKQKLVEQTKATIILCDKSVVFTEKLKRNKLFIIVLNPKYAFIKILESLFSKTFEFEKHPTAVIHSKAEIHKDVFLGPFTYIDKCKVGKGTIIHGHCHIYDNVFIGKNVIIHAGCVIGADGFGYVRTEDNSLKKFPHLGGVIIEDNVEIGANTCIDRGGLGNTVVREGAKIDNLVHIAHNVIIGKHSGVVALAMVGGSCNIDDYAWISPSAVLRDTIHIGNNAMIGMGSVVTKDVPDGETWAGVPARPMNEFLEIQKKMKTFIKIE